MEDAEIDPFTLSNATDRFNICGGLNHNASLSSDQNDSSSEPPTEEESLFCGLYDFLIEAVLMGALCVFGFVGNGLSAVCLWKDRSKTATPFLLVSLEIADTMFLATVVGLRVLDSIQTFTYRLPFMVDWVPYMGKYLFPCAMAANTSAVYMTLLVTLNRYFSVCMPYDVSDLCSIRHARRHVVGVWIFAILFNVPRFFEFDIVKDDLSGCDGVEEAVGGGQQLVRSWLSLNPLYRIIYQNVLYFLVNFLLPLVSLVLLNYKLIAALRRTRRKRESLRSKSSVTGSNNGGAVSGNGNGSSSKSEDDITQMLIVVVLVFVVSQSPALATQILGLLQSTHDCPRSFFFYVRISDLLVVANSSLNFVIYCFCSRRFRQILITLVCSRLTSATASSSATTQSSRRRFGGADKGSERGLRGEVEKDEPGRGTGGGGKKITANATSAGNKSQLLLPQKNGLDGTVVVDMGVVSTAAAGHKATDGKKEDELLML